MKIPDLDKRKHIGKIMLTYSGAAWVIIQVINFVISQYNWPIALLDVSILLFIFGLPAAFVYALNGNTLTKRLKLVYVINVFLALGVISYYFIKPNSLHPNQIKFLKFKDNQKKIAQHIQSLAILPFSNFTGDSSKDYLSYAIHDALTTEIGAISSLRVISKTTTRAISKQDKSLQEIAKELNVDAVMEGSIIFSNDQIKVDVTLMNAFPEEIQLWAKNYSVDLPELINVYTKIAKNLSEDIELPLTSSEKLNLEKSKKVDPEAYELYLKGKFNLGLLTLEGIKTAQSYFEKAIKIDSNFAPAYAELAGVFIAYKQMLFKPSEETDSIIDVYINKTFQLDSLNAETWKWYASKLRYDYKWKECNLAMEKSIELNPNLPESRAFYAHFLMMQNKWEEAWKQINFAVELDPLNPWVKFFKNVMHLHYGEFDRIKDKNGSSDIILNSHLNEYDNAIVGLKDRLLQIGVNNLNDYIDNTYKLEGFNYTLNRIGDSLSKLSHEMFIPPTLIYSIYYSADNIDKTLDWLEYMYIRKDPNLPYFTIKGPLNKQWLLENPRYQDILKRINLKNNKLR